MWLPSNARVVVSRMAPAQIATLMGGVRQGVAAACALTSRAVLVWAANGQLSQAEAAVDALGAAAVEHGPAADALFGLLHGIRPTRRSPALNAAQSAIRRRVFEHLQENARTTFAVRTLLQTHGLFNAAYSEPDQEESTLESTNF
jgi:hypothetical protein